MTHKLEGDNPEKRLSYIGATCVAGQRNIPAAVARARIEYVPEPGSTVSKYRSAERSRISEYDNPSTRSCGSGGGSWKNFATSARFGFTTSRPAGKASSSATKF